MDLHFSTKQQKDFLKRKGYTFKKTKITMADHGYHDEVDYRDEMIDAIYKNGKMYKKPGGYSFGEGEWVENVFNEELAKALLTL